ncbi:MAG: hypothetical protein ACLPLP_22645 [Mycobacterium sp.]
MTSFTKSHALTWELRLLAAVMTGWRLSRRAMTTPNGWTLPPNAPSPGLNRHDVTFWIGEQ